ncbi:MAG TPA: hypothetical protein VMW64_09800 [Dehalococcoidia bacterium]|nr:hypothetical protein [Dehalococcoidia bacterium]
MDTNPEQRQSKQPAGQQPYIGEEALRTLARMIARRLLAEPKYGANMPAQPDEAPEALEETLTDLTDREE